MKPAHIDSSELNQKNIESKLAGAYGYLVIEKSWVGSVLTRFGRHQDSIAVRSR